MYQFTKIYPSISPLLFWVVIIFGIIKFTNKHAYKELTKFTSLNKMPTSTIRLPNFSYNNTKLNNVVKMSESNNQLFIKLPIIKPICIPMRDLTSVTVEAGAFKRKKVSITLKDKNIPKISFSLNPNQLSQFPHLMRFAESTIETKNTGRTVTHIAKIQKPNYTTKAITSQKIHQMDPMLESKTNNGIRALLFIVGLILAGYILSYFL